MRKVLSRNTVVSDPKIRGGRPTIAGTSIMVSDIALYEASGMTPDDIAAALDLSLAQVHAALAYYFEHKAEIDAEIAESDRRAEMYRERLTRGRDQILPRRKP
mgnify:FL=1